MKQHSRKAAVELWKRDRDVQQNRQYGQKSEQMITIKGPIMSSCKGSLILLFNSTILQGDCHFVEEVFNFEPLINNDQSQPSSEEEKWKIETDLKN